jgi:phosphohistidine swiveling domain-containing protein
MSFCISLDARTPPEVYAKLGGKARSLLRLAAAGLPTPPALVVTTDLHAALQAAGPPQPPTLAGPEALATLTRAGEALARSPFPPGFADELARGLAALAPEPEARFAVRSSATVEDQAGALAPGLFASRLDVGREDVAAAVRAVLQSALTPGVAAYLGGRAGTVAVAVLVHGFVAGGAAGAVGYDPGGLAPPLIEVHAGGALSTIARARIADAARTLAAAHGAVEVEWVASGDAPTFLQLRPYQAPVRAAWPGTVELDDRGWRWDAAHNPLPLSPAQAGLVALVDERCQIAAAMLAQPAATLEDALDTFATLYEPLFGAVQPAARRARDALAAFLRRHGIDPAPRLPALLGGVASAASDRMRCARALADAGGPGQRATALAIYLALFGDEGPRWDVAAPTWRETPAALERMLLEARSDGSPPTGAADDALRDAADEIRAALPAAAHAEWDAVLAAARGAAAVSEDDDALYARIQAHVRRALLREGARLEARGVLADAEDVFWLPLDAVRADASGDAALLPSAAAREIIAAFRADEAARTSPPPIEMAAGDMTARATARHGVGQIVRGTSGSGGARIGRVRVHGDAIEPLGPTDVLVARTLLPTELPLLGPVAIVVETGGALDHVAAQARERGIPAVVGAAGATHLLRDGDEVLVDADAGLVVRLTIR